MNRQHLALAVCFTVAPCVAQKTDISVRPAQGALEYTIESKAEIQTDRKVLIDGEERDFGRRGGGGGGAESTRQKVVFVEGPSGSKWREYVTAEATVKRPGFDGEERVDEIAGGLAGKKIFIAEDDAGLVVREGDEKGEALPRNLTRGLPAKIDLSGLAPSAAIAVGEEYDVSKKMRAALEGLIHPVAAERAGGEGRRGRGGEGRGGGGRRGGGEGGGESGGEGRGRRGGGEGGAQGGGRRGGGGFRGFGASAQNAAFTTLTNENVDWKATGKLVSVEDGIAVVSLQGKLAGEGTPAELGMGFGGRGGFGRGGRGGRGGGGGGAGAEGDAKVELNVKGTLTIRVADHQLQALELDGDLKSSSETVRDMGDRGEMEMYTDTKGTFSLKMSCKPSKSE